MPVDPKYYQKNVKHENQSKISGRKVVERRKKKQLLKPIYSSLRVESKNTKKKKFHWDRIHFTLLTLSNKNFFRREYLWNLWFKYINLST